MHARLHGAAAIEKPVATPPRPPARKEGLPVHAHHATTTHRTAATRGGREHPGYARTLTKICMVQPPPRVREGAGGGAVEGNE